mgnify:CR=1 FL=1
MTRPKQRRKVLLLEPNYANKFPPIGLMKIATYYRNLGNWDIVFYKGDLKRFIIEQISNHCIEDLNKFIVGIDWHIKKDLIVEYIRTRKREYLDELANDNIELRETIFPILSFYKDYYWKNIWKDNPEWDRVYVTTLFTFYWDITIETINFAKFLVKKKNDLMVGGVLASIQPNEIYRATSIKPYVGTLQTPGQLDKGDTQIIDQLPLDYSILDEIDYKYTMSNAFYSYTTRGCIRQCPFCAVPILEPNYQSYIPLRERVNLIRERFGDQKDLLLMDNNVLASKEFPQIIQDIIDCGFGKGATFSQPNHLDIAIRNLEAGINDHAYIRKSQSLIMEFYNTLKGEESFEVYKIISQHHIGKLLTSKKENILSAYKQIKPYHDKHFKSSSRLRFVDFNQGLDARLFNEDNVKLLSKIAIRPLRIAFDNIKILPFYEKAIRLCAKAGLKDFSNYLLYNFDDKPVDLYRRLKINVELCEELNVSIYSFPMKYHPIRHDTNGNIDYSHNRDFIGKFWNRKYIRAVQAILNSTKGKIGKGKSFFYKAFGNNEDCFLELLEMPETFILYRFFFEWLDNKSGKFGTAHWRKCWKKCMSELSDEEKIKLLDLIHHNNFGSASGLNGLSQQAKELLSYYTNFRKDIITPGTELYRLKKEYDSNPTIRPKRKS